MKDRASKRCLNPWFKFLAILCVAVFTLLAIFEMEKNHISLNIHRISSLFQEEESAEYILVAATGADITSLVAAQFETSPVFLVVEEYSRGYSSFSNNPSSYDISAIRDFIRQQRVEAVIAGTMEIGTMEIGSKELGTPEIGILEIGIPEIGIPEIGIPELGIP
jgi:hypothetical protein